jgi:hypothetical protein
MLDAGCLMPDARCSFIVLVKNLLADETFRG